MSSEDSFSGMGMLRELFEGSNKVPQPNLSVKTQIVELKDYNITFQTWLARPCPFEVGDIVVGDDIRYVYPNKKVPGIVVKILEGIDRFMTSDDNVKEADMIIAIIHPVDNCKRLYKVNSENMSLHNDP